MDKIDINMKVKKGLQFRAFQLFFIILGIQVGVGILGTPRYIFMEAQQDAWVSIIIAMLYMLLIAWIMFTILGRYKNADIFGIQVDIFGKWIGKFLGTIYILLFFAELLSVFLSYIEVVQIFLYPTMPSFIMGLILIIPTIYAVLGGMRVIVGIVFLFTLLSPWVFGVMYDPITRMEAAHFLPLFDASVIELLKGAKTTAYSFFGLEILFVIYPFIDNKEKAKLPTYLGLLASSVLVFVTTVISIGYFSPNDFNLIDWPVLSLFKSVSFSFMERFDYLVVVEWMMVIIPSMILFTWMITHGMKRLYSVPQRKTLYAVCILLLIFTFFIKSSYQITEIGSTVSEIGFWIIFVYPIVLLPLVLIKKRGQKRKGVKND